MNIFSSLIFLIITLFLFGCKQHETAVEKANREKILLVGNSADPLSLDPHFATTLPEYNVLLSLFEGLVNYHPQTCEPIPGVAESWEISGNGLIYTFYLRKNARWSHGQPVVADDFLFAFKRALTANLGSPNATQLYVIKNAQAFHKGEIDDFSKVGVKLLNTYTLELTLENETPHLLNLLCMPIFYPVHPSTIIQHHALDKRDTAWTRPGNLVSNGPFMLSSKSAQGPVEVVQNPNYWNKKIVDLRKIKFFGMGSGNTEEIAFRAGQLHVTDTVSMNTLEKYIEEKSPYLRMSPALGLDYYTLNTKLPPFNNIKVRQALSLAIDRDQLIEKVLKNTKYRANSFIPPNLANFNSITQLPYDPQKAKQLLAEAGYPSGLSFPNIEILFNSSEIHKLVAEAIQNMWSENLGLKVTLINQEYKVYLTNRTHGNFMVARCSWVGDYLDPSTFMDIFTESSGNNYTGWSHPEYENLILKSNQTTDNSLRYKYFQRAEELLLTETPVLPLYFYKGAYLIQPNVEGWYPNILDFHPYQYVKLKSDLF